MDSASLKQTISLETLSKPSSVTSVVSDVIHWFLEWGSAAMITSTFKTKSSRVIDYSFKILVNLAE